jgi:hypothetical protein
MNTAIIFAFQFIVIFFVLVAIVLAFVALGGI